MKKLALGAVALTLMLTAPASAQYAEFGIGPGGPSVYVGPGHGYYGGPGYGPRRSYYRDSYMRHREYPGYRRHYRSYEYD
jgi:hypothetical protein